MHALFLLQHQSFNPYFIYLVKFIYLFIVPSLEERGIQKFFFFYLGDKNRWNFQMNFYDSYARTPNRVYSTGAIIQKNLNYWAKYKIKLSEYLYAKSHKKICIKWQSI